MDEIKTRCITRSNSHTQQNVQRGIKSLIRIIKNILSCDLHTHKLLVRYGRLLYYWAIISPLHIERSSYFIFFFQELVAMQSTLLLYCFAFVLLMKSFFFWGGCHLKNIYFPFQRALSRNIFVKRYHFRILVAVTAIWLWCSCAMVRCVW